MCIRCLRSLILYSALLAQLLLHRASGTSAKKEAKLSKLAIVILAGDCMNNFMDGISIGAGYSYQLSTGIKLSTAIAFEEYTHKLGNCCVIVDMYATTFSLGKIKRGEVNGRLDYERY